MKLAYLKYFVALLLFGLNGIVASNIVLPSVYIVLYRTLLGSLFLLLLYLVGRHKFTFMKNKRDLACIVLSGVAMGISWMFLFEAYRQIGVSIASLLYYCGPVIVMALSPLIFKERLTLIKVVGFLTVLGGVVLVNGQSKGDLNTYGIILGLLSAATYSVMVMANKKSKRIVGMENALMQLITAFLTVAVFILCRDGISLPMIHTSDIVWIAILGLLNTGVGCYFYFSSIGKLPVQSVAVLGYLEPLSAVVFSVILLGEVILPLQLVGGVLIIGGAIIGECVKQHSSHI